MDQKLDSEAFVPKGAIAFFALLILVMASIWLLTYGIMIARH